MRELKIVGLDADSKYVVCEIDEPAEQFRLAADDRLLARLGLQVGDRIGLGDATFAIAAQVVEDPETSVGFINLGPRLTMNASDLPATGLIAEGSRVSYRLGVAGPPAAVADFRRLAAAAVGPGQRVEDVRDARPEIRAALDRAE